MIAPCQDISLAGKGAGLEGDRSGLWFEFERAIRLLRPRFVVVENVAALFVRGFDVVLGGLAALGFDAEWSIVSAASVGAPHLRRRVFILAHALGDELRQQPVTEPVTRDDGTQEPLADLDGGGFQVGPQLDSQAHEDATDGHPRRRHVDGRCDQVADASSVGPSHRHARPIQGAALDERPTIEPERRRGYSLGWEVEPDVGRVADGVPARVDRLRALGNAVVPQVAEVVGRRLLELAA